MARPLIPRRQIAFKWTLDLQERIREEIQTRDVRLAMRLEALSLRPQPPDKPGASNDSDGWAFVLRRKGED